ncbi:LysR substrate-binding domain-containing protein [Pelomonas sp. KK5]|uniref:LysR substrate-binding domain-containing protein n=1 Tax=Pelomonas sp. KK5 TaxID=1855730 RepID=UPI00097C33DC|nr:LysR substrate-binding domain-containing protein [Pelomonas sp. KK5]
MNLFVSLKYLVALDDHRHFGRAAVACHVTQPALSNAIRALEENFGCAIVKRGRAFAGFTPEGERILASARRMLNEHELLQQDLTSSAGQPVGNLLLGAVPTAMPIAARFGAMLQDRHPGIRPTLRSMSSVELEGGLENLALDMALGYAERVDEARSALRVIPQYVEHYYLLSRPAEPRGEGLQMGPGLAWSEAAELPLCLLSPEMHNRTLIDRAFFTACGRAVTAAIETNSILTLVLSVRAGRVASVLPGALLSAMQGDAAQLLARRLVSPVVEVPMALLVHDSNRPSRTLEAALAFADSAEWREQLARHAGLLPGDPG